MPVTAATAIHPQRRVAADADGGSRPLDDRQHGDRDEHPAGGHEVAAGDVGREVPLHDEHAEPDRQGERGADHRDGATHARGATRTAHSASVIAAVEWPLGQEPMSTPRISPARGCPNVDFSVCVVRPVTTSSTATAPARAIRPRRSATPTIARPISMYGPSSQSPATRDVKTPSPLGAAASVMICSGRGVDRLDGVRERGAEPDRGERDQAGDAPQRAVTAEGRRGVARSVDASARSEAWMKARVPRPLPRSPRRSPRRSARRR